MEKIFEKEKRSTLPGQVANQIREAIKSGKLKPGDRLIETVLAREMNIGRNAVREAIRYIEKEGLIVTIPFKGAQVVEMSKNDLKDIYDVRNALETLALNTLAMKIDNEKTRVLDAVVKEMKAVSKKGNLKAIIDVDLKFHRTLCELSENKVLLEAWSAISNRLRAFIANGDGLYGEDTPEVTLGTHYPVVDAIKNSDFKLAV
ncbi:MAG: GntR family transcriptional regulator, partial [Desulfobacteraceae bacterium]|nr:GntR family transcriptional regulator [Desulfobacteraceae bacterium]